MSPFSLQSTADNNWDFRNPPGDDLANIDNDNNPLPGWSMVLVSGTAITVALVSDVTVASLYRCVFSAAAGIAADETYLETDPLALVDGTFRRQELFSFIGEMTAAVTVGFTAYISVAFLKDDGTTTGTVVETAILGSGIGTALPGDYGVPPANARYARIRIGMRRTGAAGLTGTASFSAVHLFDDHPDVFLPDLTDPVTYSPTEIFQGGGQFNIYADSRATQPAALEMSSVSDFINLRPAGAAGTGIIRLDGDTVSMPVGGTSITSRQGTWDLTRLLAKIADGNRQRNWSAVGFQPFCYPIGVNGGETLVAANIAVDAARAIPFVLAGHMAFVGIEVWCTDTATARSLEWRLYEDRNNASATVNQVAVSGASLSFTPVAAALRSSAVNVVPTYLGPGIYWLLLHNNHASSTFGVGVVNAGTAAFNNAMNQATFGALATTASLASANWTRNGNIWAGVRLVGRMPDGTNSF